eukprot:jgi/Tetstr1/435840/TSEL_024728.t1
MVRFTAAIPDARILQRDLDDVFQIYDLLAPAEEPLRDLVEDGTDLLASSPASSAELFKTITAALALCTTVALRINKRGKKLHVEHEYGAEVAKEFDAVDPLGGKGSADYKELKKAIEKVKAKKPSSSSSREKPSSSSREPESLYRGSDDRREGGRREEKSPSDASAQQPLLARCPFTATLLYRPADLRLRKPRTAAMVGPPPMVYSGTLRNLTTEPLAVEVCYLQEREEGNLEEVEHLELAAGQEAPLAQKTRSEGSWESTYHIARVVARGVGASNAMTILEAPMPGVSSPTVDYKFDIKPQDDGRLALQGSK